MIHALLPSIEIRLATQLGVRPAQVAAAVRLLEEGATVPFIARYRKEATEGLDDTQLRTLETQLAYLKDLEARRLVIVESVREQDKLTPELEAQLLSAETKTELEDLYLPYKPKRRTKAQIAKEAGLNPLAFLLLETPTTVPEEAALGFLSEEHGILDAKMALDGARHILIEHFSERPDLVGHLREWLWTSGVLHSTVQEEKRTEASKFSDYFEYSERLEALPSHRILALLRGRNEGFLQFSMVPEGDPLTPERGVVLLAEKKIAARFNLEDQGRPADRWLLDTVRLTWRGRLAPSLENELITRLRERAEEGAIKVFADNLKDVLLASPAGAQVTMGLDPGIRTGVKVAVVDTTGRLLDTATVYPHEPRRDWHGSLHTLSQLVKKHQVKLIAIGNGTASRETERLAAELITGLGTTGVQKIVVSEAGASVYSASELASQEFPDLDVSLRGAVSIARRLQDPLAELVKIDPKSIGVGQYQHDVNQSALARSLDAVVEDCVNAVGVDVNTASIPLLARISGLSARLAHAIVAYRDEQGAFPNREALKKVRGLGEKTFEQAAGFLRILNGTQPLDASAVHPEAYPVVERILQKTGQTIRDLMGNGAVLRTLLPSQFTDARFGLPTVEAILSELDKPGRDPRPEFKTATFKEGVETLNDLKIGMILEGVVTNVTHFGAFVDIGVHQDGLVHVSALSDKFIKDPRECVKTGQIVRVKVLEVDAPRKRIALTLRLKDSPSGGSAAPRAEARPSAPVPTKRSSGQAPVSAMAAAFSALKKR